MAMADHLEPFQNHPFLFMPSPPTEIYTLSLHDALPICYHSETGTHLKRYAERERCFTRADRKSTRLNSSHANNSYAVFCLKKKRPEDLATAAYRALQPFGQVPAIETDELKLFESGAIVL